MLLKNFSFRTWIIGGLGLLALLLVLAFTGLWWYVFHTQAGVNFVVARITQLPQARITLSGVSGTLADSFAINHFELDEAHVHVSAEHIRINLTPIALLALTIRAESFSASQVTVTLKTTKDVAATKPLRFLPNFLSVSIGRVDISQPKIITTAATVIEGEHVKARFGMYSQRINIDDVNVVTHQYAANGNLKILAQRPIGLEIEGVIRLPAPRGPDFTAEAALNGTIEKLRIKGSLLTPSIVAIEGELFRAANQWQMAGAVHSSRFGLEPWLDKPPFTMEAIALQFNGEPTNLRVKGQLVVPKLDNEPLLLDSKVRYSARILDISAAIIEPSNTNTSTTTTARINFNNKGRAHIDATTQWRNLRWPLRAAQIESPTGRASITGAMPYAFNVNADVRVAPDKTGAATGNVTANGSISNTALIIDAYKAVLLDGDVEGKGQWIFSPQPAWQLNVTANNLNPQSLPRKELQQFPGKLNFVAAGQGTGIGEQAAFDISLSSLSGTLRGEKISGKGAVGRTRESWSARNFSLNLGANRLAFNGSLSQKSDFTWSLDIPELQRFVPQAAGELHTRGALHGKRKTPQGNGVVNGKNLRFGDWHAEQIDVDVNIDLAEGHASKLNTTGKQVGWRGLRLESLLIQGSGNIRAHTIELHGALAPTKPRSAGKPVALSRQLTMTVSGDYLRKTWRGSISALQVNDKNDNPPTITASAATAFFSADQAQLSPWCALWQDRKLCASGSWKRTGEWQAAIDSDALALSAFDGTFPDSAHYEGFWKIRGQMVGRPRSLWTGDVNVQVSDATLSYQPVEGAQETVQLGSGNIDLNATATQFMAITRIVTPGTTSIEAKAQLARSAQQDLMRSPLNAGVLARTADANLLPLFFPDLDRSAGELRADLRATGSLAAPQIQGEIELLRGELDLYRYNFKLRDIGALARIVDNRIDFNGGALIGDGKVAVDGQFAWTNAKPLGRLTLKGENLLVVDLPDYQVVASPDLTFGIDGKRIDASGEVVIPRAHIQPTDLRGAVQRSPDARLIAEPTDEQRGFDVFSNVLISLGNDVQLETYGLKGQLRGAVTTVTRPHEVPRGRGELSVSDGRYEAYGQELNIERGRLLFDASPLDDPGLDILATRAIETQKVGVNVRGTLRAPRMSLYADPSLPQTQIVAYLFTGKPIDDLKSRDAAAVGDASNKLALQGGGFLASQIGRRIGIEQVSVETSGLDDASLVLGKFLSPRLFVSYGISLTESINTLKLRYTISDKWLVKTEAGQYQSGDLEFRIER